MSDYNKFIIEGAHRNYKEKTYEDKCVKEHFEEIQESHDVTGYALETIEAALRFTYRQGMRDLLGRLHEEKIIDGDNSFALLERIKDFANTELPYEPDDHFEPPTVNNEVI